MAAGSQESKCRTCQVPYSLGPKIHWLHFMAKESHEVTLVLREGEICPTSWWEEQHSWNWAGGGHFCRSSTMERWVGC